MTRQLRVGGTRPSGWCVAVFGLVVGTSACTRIAEVYPQEIPKLVNSSGPPVLVHLVNGDAAFLDPERCRFIRIIPRSGGAQVYRPPFRADFSEGVLSIQDQEGTPALYGAGTVEHFQIVQNDSTRGEPFLVGVFVGAIVGAALGAAAASGCSHHFPDAEGFCLDRGVSTVLGGVGGGALGVLVAIPFSVRLKYY